MLAGLAITLVLLAVVWWARLRPRSPFNVRPRYELLRGTPPHQQFDYVVIGGGPAGLAAARALLERTEDSRASVLLVERGDDPLPRTRWAAYGQAVDRDRLLSFAPDTVYLPAGSGLVPGRLGPTLAGPCVDDGAVAHRPFRLPELDDVDVHVEPDAAGVSTASAAVASLRVRARILDILHAYTVYPQGRGLGGTTRLDWGVHLPSIFGGPASAAPAGKDKGGGPALPRRWWELPLSLPSRRSPLSWAFAEAAASAVGCSRYLPTAGRPCERGAVYPLLQRIDVDDRRLPLSSALLLGAPPAQLARLSVLVGHVALSLNAGHTPAGAPVVASVTCACTGTQERCTIEVVRGVVVCGGVVQTPRLLRTLGTLPSPPARSLVRDVLALPFIFRTQSRLSSDAANVRDGRGTALWCLAQRGPYLQPLTDTVASLPVPELGGAAEVRVVLLPFGGRDPRRFYQLGWDRVLGAFPEGLTMLLVLSGVDGLSHPLELHDGGGAPAVGTRSLFAQRHLKPLAVVEGTVEPLSDAGESTGAAVGVGSVGEGPLLAPALQEKVLDAFVRAMRVCRTLTATPPFSHLVAARGGAVDGSAAEEAIDFALLKDDPARALRLARLYHTPRQKQSAAARRELGRLLEWAYRSIHEDAYMRLYVAQHAYWLGFGSGSSEPFLEKARSCAVAGVTNVVVGDSSAVTDAVWRAGGMDTLAAGSVSSAMDAGRRAAAALVEE